MSYRLPSSRVASVACTRSGDFYSVHECKSRWRENARVTRGRRRCSPSSRNNNVTRCIYRVETDNRCDSEKLPVFVFSLALDFWQIPANQIHELIASTPFSSLCLTKSKSMETKYTIPTRFSSTSVSAWYRLAWRHKVHDTSRVLAESVGFNRKEIFTAALSHHCVELRHSLRSLPQLAEMWLAVLRRGGIQKSVPPFPTASIRRTEAMDAVRQCRAGPIHRPAPYARVSREIPNSARCRRSRMRCDVGIYGRKPLHVV